MKLRAKPRAKKAVRKVHKPKPTKLLAEVQDLIYRLSWDASSQYSMPFDECLREGYWQFMKAWQYYDPERGVKFSSFYALIFKWQFVSRIREKIKRQKRLPMISLDERLWGLWMEKKFAPATDSPCLEVADGLSADAQEIIRLLVKTPDGLLKGVRSPHHLLARVKRFLMQRDGYPRKRFEKATREIRKAFREVWNQT